MTASSINEAKLEKYKDFVTVNYKEPINGDHEDATNSILEAIHGTLHEVKDDDNDDSDAEEVEPQNFLVLTVVMLKKIKIYLRFDTLIDRVITY